ncbi:hypothetical protein R3P38DRAFT_2508687 [Favolaschia claudopus]|uniref:Uncharacterized protein n=1 Tax=Favolaschia claudopus TaxID=2862362 RepID=A0AAW0CWH3_9AGAR
MPTYRRKLSPNELSYYLPSRAYGLNDMFMRVTIHAPLSLMSPTRVRLAWAILRLRHSLLASRIEMRPGHYDDAQFAYTPPSSASHAFAETASSVRILNNVSSASLTRACVGGPRILSSDCLARLDLARQRPVSSHIYEFELFVMFAHLISDAIGLQASIQCVLELVGGSDTPGGAPRSDADLRKILEAEWVKRWGKQAMKDVLAPATEARIMGAEWTRFQDAAWKVDNDNIQRGFIGGQVFPRIKSKTTDFRFIQTRVDVRQTAAIFAKCKAQRVSVANMAFVLCNFAWLRVCAAHPEIVSPKELPTLMYTAINLRRFLQPSSELESPMSLALDYYNIVLPSYLPRSVDLGKAFWARGREAQRQIGSYTRSPVLMQRAIVNSKIRGERAKAWARIDDEADGTVPRTARPQAPTAASTSTATPAVPSIALLGVSHSGNWDEIYITSAYPSIKLVNAVGGAKRAPGGMLVYTWTCSGKLNLVFLWDEAGFARGIVEEFRRGMLDCVHEYVLEDGGLRGTAEVVDCLKEGERERRIHLLGLSSSIITTPTSSPAAKNRYLHVPGTPGIYKIPGPSISYLWSELRYFIQPGLNFELVRGWNRPEGVLDESVESFLTRRGHAVTARVLGSAIGHGIYAADARLLSVRAAFPRLWELEEKGKGRILWYLLTRGRKAREEERKKKEEERRGYEVGDEVWRRMEGVSVFSFKDGMVTLPDALTRAVMKNPRIQVLAGTQVLGLRPNDEQDGFEVRVASEYFYPLNKIIPKSHPLPYLTTNPTSSVTALNLVFPGPPGKIFPRGFGYLVCRPQEDYPADDAGILGVTFDSETLPAQDDVVAQKGVTKVTVMMGGPHRSVDTALPVVLAHLQYQLNRRKPLPEPLLVRRWEQNQCIPTPLPGHLERMDKLREALSEEGWGGRLEVVGAGVRGVSVGDCVESGRNVGAGW